MIFFTMSSLPPVRKISPYTRSCLKPQFRQIIDPNGFKVLEKTGEIDIFDEVQMYRDECNIYNIIKRYQLGDTAVLNRCSSSYIDTLGQPKTLQEALNLSIKLKNDFDALKPEVKLHFDNNFNTFLSSVVDGSIVDVLKSFSENKPIDKVKEDESNE